MSRTMRTPLVLLAGVVIGVGGALTHGVMAEKQAAIEFQAGHGTLPVEDLQTFVEILNRVKTDYVEEVTDKQLLENAIRGMLAGLDPHSAYLDTEEFREISVQTSGRFGGLGIEVQMQNGFVRVVAPIDDTPAAKAGVQPGDLIVKIDDTPVKGLTLTDAVRRMRGDPGTKIVLTIVRESEAAPFVLEMQRDLINVSSVRARMLEPGMAYLRVSQFTSTTAKSLSDEMARLQAQAGGELRGMILDLRNNPGGVLNAAVEVSDAFLDKGAIVSIRGRETDANREFNATPGDLLDGKPLVVLVNAGSASASEIVAGALQDHKRGVIVGDKTFGKGSVQTILPLQNESAIKLTTARYFTPNDRSIQAEGITPDVPIRLVKVTREEGNGVDPIKEADLTGHLEQPGADGAPAAVGTAPAAPAAESTDPQVLAETDYALYESLNLLRGLVVMQSR